MTSFQVTIVSAEETEAVSEVDEAQGKYAVRKHTGGAGKIVDSIEALGGVWDKVIEKLTDLASQSEAATVVSQYELSSIEFNIGIEAGLNIGLVTKGDASVSISFTKKDANSSN